MANAGDTENNRATIAAVILSPDMPSSFPSDMGSGYNIARQRQMLDAATAIPHPVKFDPSVLMAHPAPEGRRHDEVRSGFGIVTTLIGKTWTEQHRMLPSNDAPMHRSVYERFDLPLRLRTTWKPYRPGTLRITWTSKNITQPVRLSRQHLYRTLEHWRSRPAFFIWRPTAVSATAPI
jgi:hypothetical protein